MGDPPRLARILDPAKMLQKRLQPGFRQALKDEKTIAALESKPLTNSRQKQSVNRVNEWEPWLALTFLTKHYLHCGQQP